MVLKKHAVLFNFEGTYSQIRKCSDNSEEVTPVPIPNTVVKLLSADDTWRATSREIRTSLLFSFFVLFGPVLYRIIFLMLLSRHGFLYVRSVILLAWHLIILQLVNVALYLEQKSGHSYLNKYSQNNHISDKINTILGAYAYHSYDMLNIL